MLDEALQFGDGLGDGVVHDVEHAERSGGTPLLLTLAHASLDALGGIAPLGEPGPLLVGVGVSMKTSRASGSTARDGAGALHVDLEEHVRARRRLRHRRALAVVEELDPLEEAAGVDVVVEGGPVGEDIGILGLAGPSGAGGPRPAEPDLGMGVEERVDDGALADAPRAGHDDVQGLSRTVAAGSLRVARSSESSRAARELARPDG